MRGILLATIVESIKTRKDNTVCITLGTNELSQGKAGEIFGLVNKIASVYICAETVTQREIDQVDKVQPEMEGKSQSKRIRDVLYILFTQNNEGWKDFDAYYKTKTEAYIEHLKSKIKD